VIRSGALPENMNKTTLEPGRKARILMVDETYPPDTRWSVPYSSDLVRHLRGLGHYVDVLTVGEGFKREVIPEALGSLYRMGNHFEFSSARLSGSVLKFLVQNWHRFDLIHLNSPNPIGELSFLICKRIFGNTGPRAVLTYHADVVGDKPLSGL
jgi:hypothetical protein